MMVPTTPTKEAPTFLPEEVLEEFRCSKCRLYLSFGPLRVLPNGDTICDICERTDEEPICVNSTLKQILSKVLFPCRFRDRGCDNYSTFGCSSDHEFSCPYNIPSFYCPLLTWRCWKGQAWELEDHCRNFHPKFFLEGDDLVLNLKNKVSTLLLKKSHGILFEISIVCENEGQKFFFIIRYPSLYDFDAFYKIKIFNHGCVEHLVSLKERPCEKYPSPSPYDEDAERSSDDSVRADSPTLLDFVALGKVVEISDRIRISLSLRVEESAEKRGLLKNVDLSAKPAGELVGAPGSPEDGKSGE